MDHYKLEEVLKGKHDSSPMSPQIRSRLDETYHSLSKLSVKHSSQNTWLRRSWLRKTAIVAASSGVLCAGILGSAFISPVMADSLKKIPLVASLFSTIEGDTGLKTAGNLGLTMPVDSTAFYDQIKLEVSETIFDGTRAAYLLNVTAPNLKDGKYYTGKKIVKLSNAIENTSFYVDGKRQGDPGSNLLGGFYSSVGAENPNTLLFEEVFDKVPLPDSFDAEVFIKLEGIDHEFKLDIPFSMTAQAISVQPDETRSNEEYTFTVSDVQVSALTTRILTSTQLNKEGTLGEKDQRKLIRTSVAVFDDQGQQLTALNGDGVIPVNTNSLDFDRRYASTSERPKYLILRPFVINDDFAEKVKSHQFIEGLEIKIELPQ